MRGVIFFVRRHISICCVRWPREHTSRTRQRKRSSPSLYNLPTYQVVPYVIKFIHAMPRDVDPAGDSQTIPSVAAQQVLRPKASISIAAPKPRPLGDRETFSFNSWHSTVTFYLSQKPNYLPFICGDIQKWQKDSGQPGCL